MEYLIDGYNLLFSQLHPGENLRIEREHLVSKLAHYSERLKWNVTIVFDSQYQRDEGSFSHYKSLTICFTNFNQTADEYIVNVVKQAKKASQITVVTSDEKLAWYCRRELAKTMSVSEFAKQLTRQYQRKQQESASPKLALNPLKKVLNSISSNQAKQKQIAATEPQIRTSLSDQIVKSPLDNAKNSIEECFQAYLEIFEKNVSETIIHETKTKKPKKATVVSTHVESDTQRWLRLFGLKGDD